MPPQPVSELSPVSVTSSQVPVLVDFLNAVPAPITAVLVVLAPQIALVRHVIEIVSWKSSWDESWLLLASWWALCLLGDIVFRYMLPLAVLFMLVMRRFTTMSRSAPPPATESNIANTITDLTTIHALLFPSPPPYSPTSVSPALPTSAFPSLPLPVVLRMLISLYIPYLALTYLVRLRILLALLGTLALTWRAPWASTVRRLLWSSAFIRWTVYRIWTIVSGLPPPVPAPAPPPDVPDLRPNRRGSEITISSTTSAGTRSSGRRPGQTVRFLFTLYENQRWWMGLDWTAALLPTERPAWCSPSPTLAPMSPPAVFELPSPTTVVFNGGREKRHAHWHWEEPEWRVVVKREDGGKVRVERPLPSIEASGAAPGGDSGSAGARLLRAAGKRMSLSVDEGRAHEEATQASGSAAGSSTEAPCEDEGGDILNEDEVPTDADGWVYGDNKWEARSGKGGIGKYTRFRRWTRIAVLTETIEEVDVQDPDSSLEGVIRLSTVSDTTAATIVEPESMDADNSSSAHIAGHEREGNNSLRQRLKTIAQGGASSSSSHS